MLVFNLLLKLKKQLTHTLLRTTYVYTDFYDFTRSSQGKVVYSRILKLKI